MDSSTHTFVVRNGADKTAKVEGRRDAIRRAKEMSRRSWRSVAVERDDGRLTMEYRRGRLQAYKLETHDRRH